MKAGRRAADAPRPEFEHVTVVLRDSSVMSGAALTHSALLRGGVDKETADAALKAILGGGYHEGLATILSLVNVEVPHLTDDDED